MLNMVLQYLNVHVVLTVVGLNTVIMSAVHIVYAYDLKYRSTIVIWDGVFMVQYKIHVNNRKQGIQQVYFLTATIIMHM